MSEIATNQTLQKAIKPLQSAAHAGATAAVEAIQTGLSAAQSVTSALQPAAGTAVAEVFALYGRELPKKITNWKHLFFAELRLKKKGNDAV